MTQLIVSYSHGQLVIDDELAESYPDWTEQALKCRFASSNEAVFLGLEEFGRAICRIHEEAPPPGNHGQRREAEVTFRSGEIRFYAPDDVPGTERLSIRPGRYRLNFLQDEGSLREDPEGPGWIEEADMFFELLEALEHER